MKTFFKILFVVVLAAVIGSLVAAIVSKKKFQAMTDDEIREYLKIKLSGRFGDAELQKIQDKVIACVRGGKACIGHYVEEENEATDELADMGEGADVGELADVSEDEGAAEESKK